MLPNFKSERIAAQGAKLPFLVLPGIRGLWPYNPTKVMRQFGRTQIIPVQGDASSFVVDYDENGKIPYAKIILQELAGRVNMKGDMTENRYEVEYVDEYKTWLQNDLHGAVNLIPHTNQEIEDVHIRPTILRKNGTEESKNFRRENKNFNKGSESANFES